MTEKHQHSDMAPEPGRPLVGILGGMGPEAGVDLARKLVSETAATRDADHVPFAMFSVPKNLPDRTAFLTGAATVNPAVEIARQLLIMEGMRVTAAAMACNTAHAAPIFDEILRLLGQDRDIGVSVDRSRLRLLHLVDETISWLGNRLKAGKIGILGTEGTYRFRLYDEPLAAAGFEPVRPEEGVAFGALQQAIFNPDWGIKSGASPVSDRAAEAVGRVLDDLKKKDVRCVVLGCTELPLAVAGWDRSNVPVVDPTRILARALIRESYPDRLREEDSGATP